MFRSSIADAMRAVADYVENEMESGSFDIAPGVHEITDRRRAAALHAEQKTAADALRLFATLSETEPVKLAVFVALLRGLPVPDKIKKPAEWAIYDRYGAWMRYERGPSSPGLQASK